LWESYKQEKNAKLAEDLAHCFFYGLGCTKDVLFGAKLLIENKLDEEIRRRRMESHGHDGLTLKEVYLYGKYDKHKPLPRAGGVITIEWVARGVYSNTNEKTKQATLLFICWTQKENILPRDLRRLIGEMIWESRVDPELWKVKI
jgi:hypothetical protein